MSQDNLTIISSDGHATALMADYEEYLDPEYREEFRAFLVEWDKHGSRNFDPPALRRGYATFGSFNNIAKLGPEVVNLWADVLRAAPGSRLLLKWKALDDASARRRLGEAFAGAGLTLSNHGGQWTLARAQ